ncbi:MAG: BamA/TamA family outer membrane protein [Calditrichae bacterium]|nr:BamA/TamA family outer membrane protein [Calditrichia bacterium]
MIFLILFSLLVSQKISLAQESADSSDYFDSSLDVYPFVYYTPETEFAAGAGGVFTFYTARDSLLNPSNLTISGFYSSIRTYEISGVTNLFFRQNRMVTVLDITYSHKVDRFYGIGNDTPELGTEQYVVDNVGGVLDFQLPPAIIQSDRGGLVLEYRNYSILDRKENPYLLADTLTGTDGGVVSGIGMVWVWDIRDHVFFPNSGGLTQAKVIFYSKDVGSDFTYSWFEVNAKRYWSYSPDHVIAVQFYLNMVGGDPPFFKLPALGGPKIMRGYFQGRYRDKSYFAMQAEYRQYFWWRMGFVAFAGVGDVVPELTHLNSASMKTSYGFGLRFLFNKKRKINLRVDFGFGKNSSGIYFGIQEAF